MTDAIHAQVAVRRATERAASASDATGNTTGFRPQAGARADGPQLGKRGRESTTGVTETQTDDAQAQERGTTT